MYLANRPSTREHTNTVDVKASSTGAVVVPGCGMSLRRQQVRRSPEMADSDGDPSARSDADTTVDGLAPLLDES